MTTTERTEVAIITGGGSGIGRASARRLAHRGATVVVTDIDATWAAATAASLAAPGISIRCDATDESDVSRVVDETMARFGRIDTVVACAGIEIPGDVHTVSPDQFDRGFAANVRSVYLLARGTLPLLAASDRRNGLGSFTAIASDAALRGAQGWPVYAATKHAVLGLVRSVALDMAANGIRVNAVCPGWVDTPLMARTTDHAQRETIAEGVPFGRLATADDVAAAVAHLSGPDSAYVTGTAYVVDGGQLAGPFNPARDW